MEARTILRSEGYLGTLQIKKGTPVYEKMQQLRQHHVLGTRDSDRGTSAKHKDVQAAHKDANRKGERQYLEDQKKDPVTFKAFMDNYRKECPAPGKGKKRKDFDWTQQKKLTLKTSRTGDGFEGEMVDMEEYIT